MKPVRCAPGLASLLATALLTTAAFANEAQVTFSGLSIRIPPATYSVLGQQYRLAFSTADDDTTNSELYALGTSQYETFATLDYPGSEALGPLVGVFTVDNPHSGDSNINGVTDFLEVDRAITNETTTGTFEVDDGMSISRGTVTATWNRAAGATTGTVRLRLNVDEFGFANLDFNHTFEIFSYKGTLTYTVTAGSTNIPATLQLQRVGAAGTFAGPFNLRRTSPAELDRDAAVWKGPGNLDFDVWGSNDIEGAPFPVSYIARNLYGGLVVFGDGDPTTPFADEYDFWDLLIVDPNDSDGDGLPDLSDTPGVTPPARPTVAIVRDGSQLGIDITGTPSARYAVERSAQLGSNNWTAVGETTLDAAGKGRVNAGAPGEAQGFFRARAL